ncbi:Epsin-1, required for endocytosis and actin patch assembly [Phytophthora boehmeriae]|uniref:Epsin-1, required for endocytosis and actin patch assembly n=1 Tax=Phytophthora boehmeriae TaxID=109152 RepID=A0A8T1X818_9STRA|nr:Epsin-1, required for endocytosis and actin patch assembly [Phytophthora boehmeriae]
MLSPLPRTPGVRLSTSYSYEAADIPLEDQREGSKRNAVQEAREETLACWLFALVGIGYLFPFSALTQPVDYWKMLFPDYNIEFALTSTFMYTNLVFLGFIVVVFGKPWYKGRIVGGFIGQLLVLAFVPTSYFFLTSENANAIAVLGGTAIASVATAFIDSATIALVSHYPQRVQESFQLGVGLSTLIGSLYRDLTKVAFPADELLASSLIYFYTGALTIALCIGAFYKVMGLQITKKYMFRKADSSVELTERSPLLAERRLSGSDQSNASDPGPTKWSVLKKVIHLQLLITAVFLASLSVWPPLVTEIKTYNFPSLQESGWWSLILLTIFSISDCVGRFIVNHRFGLTPGNIWVPILARFVFIPIIIGIVKGWWLQSDIWSVLSVLFLGFGNGYLGTLVIIFVSESVHSDEQHLIGPFTSFFLNFGLVLGSSVGLILENAVLGN